MQLPSPPPACRTPLPCRCRSTACQGCPWARCCLAWVQGGGLCPSEPRGRHLSSCITAWQCRTSRATRVPGLLASLEGCSIPRTRTRIKHTITQLQRPGATVWREPTAPRLTASRVPWLLSPPHQLQNVEGAKLGVVCCVVHMGSVGKRPGQARGPLISPVHSCLGSRTPGQRCSTTHPSITHCFCSSPAALGPPRPWQRAHRAAPWETSPPTPPTMGRTISSSFCTTPVTASNSSTSSSTHCCQTFRGAGLTPTAARAQGAPQPAAERRHPWQGWAPWNRASLARPARPFRPPRPP